MPFEVLPVLQAMQELYARPRDGARFQEYLQLLSGDTKADLKVPLMHFNPMAKEPLVEKLRELQLLGAEEIAAQAAQELNAAGPDWAHEPTFSVALNLADDLQGGWTNRYTTDFANTFALGPLLKRGFCTPIFWASEPYMAELVRLRTLAQGWRTRYRTRHPVLRTLAEHVAQEQFVAKHLPQPISQDGVEIEALYARYEAVKLATDQATLLTFFYGDEAARQLGYRQWGNWPAQAGFILAQAMAAKRPASAG